MKIVKASINGKETPFQKDDYYSACKMLSIHLGLSEKDEEKLLKRGYVDYGENHAQVKVLDVDARDWLKDEPKLTARDHATHRAVINGEERLFVLGAKLSDNSPFWSEVVKSNNFGGMLIFPPVSKDFQYYPLEKLEK